MTVFEKQLKVMIGPVDDIIMLFQTMYENDIGRL